MIFSEALAIIGSYGTRNDCESLLDCVYLMENDSTLTFEEMVALSYMLKTFDEQAEAFVV